MIESAGGRLNWRRLERYLDRFGNRSLTLRLGFLVERLRPTIPVPDEWVDRAIARPDEPFVPLGRPKEFGRRGEHDRRWHIIRNVPDSLLRSEVELR